MPFGLNNCLLIIIKTNYKYFKPIFYLWNLSRSLTVSCMQMSCWKTTFYRLSTTCNYWLIFFTFKTPTTTIYFPLGDLDFTPTSLHSDTVECSTTGKKVYQSNLLCYHLFNNLEHKWLKSLGLLSHVYDC